MTSPAAERRAAYRGAPRALALLVLVAGTGACATSPVAPIPLPLPETLEWASARDARPGAFLGLKTRENLVGGFDDLDFQPGIKVTRVVENSPAGRAGVRVGDVVLGFDGHATDDPEALDALVASAAAGDEATLEVQRGDSVFEVRVALDHRGDEEGGSDATVQRVHRLDPARSRAGWLTGRGGVVLVASDDDAPFPSAGVPVGSVVHAIDGHDVVADAELVRLLSTYPPGETVDVEFTSPDGERGTERVTLQDEHRRITELSIPILFSYYADVEDTTTSFAVLDLWFLSLVRYAREGEERRWTFLRFFSYASGVGEMSE